MGRRPLYRRLTEGKQFTTANLNWNVYRDNRAGNGGGGMFCDDGATCVSYHEVYDRNCGSNILLDSGSRLGPDDRQLRPSHQCRRAATLDAEAQERASGSIAATLRRTLLVHRCDLLGQRAGIWISWPIAISGCGNIKINVSHSMVQTKYGRKA